MSEEISWNKPRGESSSGPHRDYSKNLHLAENFVKKVAPSLLSGMMVEIRNGQNIPKAILMISWAPPKSSKKGNCATPISLHDDHSKVSKKVETIFNYYYNYVKNYLDKQQLKLF
jgi:hypothetical protein